jgi:hypothetical protein
MPLRYDPDTGIPSYIPDLGEELEEGKTPEPKVISTKSDVFKGDKKPTKDEYEALRDGDIVDPDKVDVAEADKMMEAIRNARPGKLDKDIATDEEVDALEQAAKAQDIDNWPLLLRLINRLRKAEGS